jgi:hypothetical protein
MGGMSADSAACAAYRFRPAVTPADSRENCSSSSTSFSSMALLPSAHHTALPQALAFWGGGSSRTSSSRRARWLISGESGSGGRTSWAATT